MRLRASVALAGVFTPVLLALPVTSAALPSRPHPVAPTVHSVFVAPVAATGEIVAAAPEQSVAGFSTIGASWARGSLQSGQQLEVRVRSAGLWSKWTALESTDTGADVHSADGRSAVALGRQETAEPVWVGRADGVQARVRVASGTAASHRAAPRNLRVVLVDAGTSPADADPAGLASTGSTAAAATPQPAIYSRAQWGADESLRTRNPGCGTPEYSTTIKVGFVHHTDSSNSYAAADVPSIIRGFYAYHVISNGWCDIGYNFLVDRFGRTWEGRFGGISKPVIGAHTGGFNVDSFGTALIGTFTSSVPSSGMRTALTNLFAWKLGAYYRNPLGNQSLTSDGFSESRWAAGKPHSFSVISGHRDADYTTCPGDSAYATLPTVRNAVLARMGSGLLDPAVTSTVAGFAVRASVLRPQSWALTVTSVPAGTVVRRYTGSTASTIDLTWDRRDSTGLPVVGTFTLTLSSSSAAGTAVPWATQVTVPATSPTAERTPPTVLLTAVPPAMSRSRTASVAFTVSDPDDPASGLGALCTIDSAAPRGCTSPVALSGLADGSHTVSVRATDPAGNVSVPAGTSWLVDATAPAVAQTAPAQLFTMSSTIPVAWSGTDAGTGLASYDVRYRVATDQAGFGAFSYPAAWQHTTNRSASLPGAVGGRDYCFSSRARDRIGNVSAWTAELCSARVLDDRALSASTSGWLRGTSSNYYAGTYTSTTGYGQVLSRSSVVTDRVALVATRCASCGSVGVYVNGVLIGKVSLYASTTSLRNLIVLPRFSLRTGTVTIRSLVSGKGVYVDGLGTSRS